MQDELPGQVTVMTKHTIATLAGDGIGEEIMRQAVKVLRVIESRNPVEFELIDAPFGGRAWFDCGASFPEATKTVCDKSDAILKGPVGLGVDASKAIPVDEQPERGAILPLRRRYDTFANFRPVALPGNLAHFSPLKPEVIGDGLDMIIIRELVGGLYFDKKETGVDERGRRNVVEHLEYNEFQIERIARVGFETAMRRKKKLHSVHKSNVLKSSVLWQEIVDEVARDFPEVQVENVLVDAAATYLCLAPRQFDVMVMENLFGDILSDQAGGVLGSLGLMPSACVGPHKSYYEPAHGSAPDIAGKNIANPYSMIGSAAMMLAMSFDMAGEADNIHRAMQSVLAAGYSTPDLIAPGTDATLVSTDEFGDRVVGALTDEFNTT